VVLASRSAESYATFPEFQRHTEDAINTCCAELVGAPFDFTYGPFLLNGALLPCLERLPDDIGWGWRPYAFTTAHRLGLSVQSLARASACPPNQRSEAETIYRMQQLAESVRGLVLAAKTTL
jgi:hypothetical protein